MDCHPVAVVQYTFTHKQYTERHKQTIHRTTQNLRIQRFWNSAGRGDYKGRPTWNAIDCSLYPVTLLRILYTRWCFWKTRDFERAACVCVFYGRAALSFQRACLGYSVQNVSVNTIRDMVFVCKTTVSCSDFTQTVLSCGHSGKINMVHFKLST